MNAPREPVTAETRVSYVNLKGKPVVFDIPCRCAWCCKCLCNPSGRCLYGMPATEGPHP